MKRFISLPIILFFAFIVGCGTTPQKSSLEIQVIQKKEFETSRKNAFASVMSVFQDLGYVIKSADMETGLITGNSPTTRDWYTGDLFSTTLTGVIDSINANRTYIRLNFVKIRQESKGGAKRATAVLDPEIYQNTFKRIQESIFIREGIK